MSLLHISSELKKWLEENPDVLIVEIVSKMHSLIAEEDAKTEEGVA